MRLSSSNENGFLLQRVDVVTEDDTIPSLLAVPHGEGPFPAVVVFHQHAGQRHLGKSEVFGLAGDPHQAFGPALARAGCVVLAPDSIAFEDRRPAGPGVDPRDDDWDQHYNAMAYRLVVGDTLMRKVLEDSTAAISALVDRTDVDSSRVVALGHSSSTCTMSWQRSLHGRSSSCPRPRTSARSMPRLSSRLRCRPVVPQWNTCESPEATPSTRHDSKASRSGRSVRRLALRPEQRWADCPPSPLLPRRGDHHLPPRQRSGRMNS
ncbi:MAG: dienelactone hydrolase family protein [Acidimicrobiales bacterium]|nr:dienelactone hydrolase family protein [Acidimicrobiales bacterium]